LFCAVSGAEWVQPSKSINSAIAKPAAALRTVGSYQRAGQEPLR
jgi:hypothetical protein